MQQYRYVVVDAMKSVAIQSMMIGWDCNENDGDIIFSRRIHSVQEICKFLGGHIF
jgi:hypothetical protein